MIVLCPKAFSASDDSKLERDFLKFFLTSRNIKAIITDEVWETFRFKMINNSTNKDNANDRIADYRGFIAPENLKLDENYGEIEAKKEYSIEELFQKTKNLIERRGVDIKLFITQEPEKYNDLKDKVEIKTLKGFYLDCMSGKTRESLSSFWNDLITKKWE